jgi:uncharacterized membrane protein
VLRLVEIRQDWLWIWELLAVTALIIMGAVMVVLPDLLEFMSEETYDAIVGSGAYATMSSEERQAHDWLLAVLGSVMIGWGITSAFIVWFGFRQWIVQEFSREHQWTWQALLVGFSLWFVFDTGVSAWNEVWFNVILNTVLFIVLIIPLVAASPKYLQYRQ